MARSQSCREQAQRMKHSVWLLWRADFVIQIAIAQCVYLSKTLPPVAGDLRPCASVPIFLRHFCRTLEIIGSLCALSVRLWKLEAYVNCYAAVKCYSQSPGAVLWIAVIKEFDLKVLYPSFQQLRLKSSSASPPFRVATPSTFSHRIASLAYFD